MERLTCTLVFLVTDARILLAKKKRGFGKGLWNGAGGKVEPDESIEQAMIRECQEEIGVTPITYTKVALHTFDYQKDDRMITVYTYLCTEWLGEPIESEEMLPQWFDRNAIPYSQMWTDDIEWLPKVLTGQKLHTNFTFGDNNALLHSKLHETTDLEQHG